VELHPHFIEFDLVWALGSRPMPMSITLQCVPYSTKEVLQIIALRLLITLVPVTHFLQKWSERSIFS